LKRFSRNEHLIGMSAPTATIERTDVELAADGDEVAFGRLVAAYHPDMVRVAYVITGDGGLGQDAVQAAWVRAWRSLDSVREPLRIRAWLLSIAANEARQILRRRRRFFVVELDAGFAAPGRADPASGIERLDLVRALQRLSPDDRSLLALRYVIGLDTAELAAMTGRSGSGIRARLSRLTARLREDLDR
jgi:RNA polymerase sigma-70 factor (ECF subfamily)